MKKFSRLLISAIIFAGMTTTAVAEEPLLKNSHPDLYVVKKGDTLWDISGRFLNEPWRWPDIWHVNPQIANPHLIYPGDKLELVYIDGKPRLRVQQDGVVKLSPEIRSTPWDGAIPAVPYDAIAPFLTRPYVSTEEELEAAPYVVAIANEHLAGGKGNQAYVRAIETGEADRFDMVRPGKPYKDFDTGEVLGNAARFIGTASLVRTGDPATVHIDASALEVLAGDRLIPATEEGAVGDFYPKAPEVDVNGAIIDVLSGVGVIGPLDIVVIDRGAADGLEQGTVLRVDRRGERIHDKIAKRKRGREYITLPNERAGNMVVFRVFERVSFGLIMDAKLALHVGDVVTNP